jgi:hypothetical protein
MNFLVKLSIEPSWGKRASSPMGLSVNGGLKHLLTTYTKRGHGGGLALSSNR